MAFTRAEHPIFWEVTHHPLVAIAVVLVIAVVVAWLVLGNFPPGPAPLTDVNFAP